MISTVYAEESIASHPRVGEILARVPKARRVSIDRYGEVFNPVAQSFRLQKTSPSLILAKKHGGFVLPAPAAYSIGGEKNFYFSHLLNCPYDCRYCFLQGMYRSAHYVLFVNYEDFEASIDSTLADNPGEDVYFFSGYDCDSLAFEGISGFCSAFLPIFEARPRAWLELRTKSASIKPLLERPAIDNCVVAYSFTPEVAHQALEHGVPSIERRIDSLRRLGEHGWRLGLRFDPLIWWEGCLGDYSELFDGLAQTVDMSRLHSVSLGPFRLPPPFFKRMVSLYPEEPLFAAPLERRGSMISYREGIERDLVARCSQELISKFGSERFFPCALDDASKQAIP